MGERDGITRNKEALKGPKRENFTSKQRKVKRKKSEQN